MQINRRKRKCRKNKDWKGKERNWRVRETGIGGDKDARTNGEREVGLKGQINMKLHYILLTRCYYSITSPWISGLRILHYV